MKLTSRLSVLPAALLCGLAVCAAHPLAADVTPASASAKQSAEAISQALAFAALSSSAAPVASPSLALGGREFSGWSGLARIKGGVAEFKLPAPIAYTVPDGPRGSYLVGLASNNDSVIDARRWYALRFDVQLDRDDPVTLRLTLAQPPHTGRHDQADSTSASIVVSGKGWQSVTVPIAQFDYYRGQRGVLAGVKTVSIHAEGQNGAMLRLRDIRFVRGNVIHVSTGVTSLPADADGTVSYPVSITNCTDKPQIVSLKLVREGWEAMPANVKPETLALAPGQSAPATISVTVPSRLPEAAQEKQVLVATPSGDGAASETVQFITIRRLSSPYLVFQKSGWDEVKAKAAKFDWAKKAEEDTLADADKFAVPDLVPGGIKSDQGSHAVFSTSVTGKILPVIVAYELTGDRRYADKLALLLRRFSDPVNGFPSTLHATSQGWPQEGGMLEGMARAYDALRDTGVLSDADRAQIEHTLRLYIALQIDGMAGGGISNWTVFSLCPAAECALAVQDMTSFNTVMYGEGGLIDHMRYGMMDDGWWYEMALSYNLDVADFYLGTALAARPFGCDLLTAHYPASLSPNVGLRPFEYENFEGMAFGKFGPLLHNTITVKNFFDGIIDYPDFRGVMFGIGDGHESEVSGGRFEKAYYAYRDPRYAAIIKEGSQRDLLYGVPDLPADTPKPYLVSAHSDNAGIAVLRSQTEGREPAGQIQASFKYGSHGSYHGHFDRLSLNSLERYGISFYNPETSWYGYGSYMYKWWVQPSLSHNLVVVDGKMQQPVQSKLLAFHSGKMMQVVAAQNDARWSNPPYLGGYDQINDILRGDKPYVPIPKDHPNLGDIGVYSEPIRDRRVMVIADDYVLLADDLKGDKPHTFDNLLQLRGAALVDADKAQYLGHAAQFDDDPLSSGQFITNVDTYAVNAPSVITSLHRVGETTASGTNWSGDKDRNETGGASSHSLAGSMHIDEHVLWPPKAEVRFGSYAENWDVGKKLTYTASGDGKTLATGTFGAWILGCGVVDVDVAGVKSLTLTTQVWRGWKWLSTIFWANAAIVTRDGRTIPLSTLPLVKANAIPVSTPGLDYEGGPVRIAGIAYADTIAAEPKDGGKPATITVDLTGLDAVRLKAVVGGDFPLGSEAQLRKTVSVRTIGQGARFLTLIEPYKDRSTIKSAVAAGPSSVHVELTDGRVQDVVIDNLDSYDQPIRVTITESVNGVAVRTETASGVEE
ncbi:MAG: hypothetical protein P4L33_07855 [Capsulimonadaceae bacterium]|nr:hypothetical protein [Capsulimonadaceae bacterium]